MTDGKTTVLYVVGTGRSGSTLLSGILGEVDGFLAAGEVRYIWARGLVENRLCGCGQPFAECPFWTAVLERAYGGRDGVDPKEMMRTQASRTRIRNFPGALISRRVPDDPGLRRYLDRLGALYRAMAEVSGRDVIVDSSKLPSYGLLLRGVPGVEVSFVHLVRDPRGAAYSWSRSKRLTDTDNQQYMQQLSTWRSATLWTIWNASVPAVARRQGAEALRLRYEDFAADPRRATERILAHVGRPDARLPFADDHTVALGPNHSAAGNPARLVHGAVAVKGDDEWRTKMRQRDIAVVNALTLPLRGRWGYGRARAVAAPAADGAGRG